MPWAGDGDRFYLTPAEIRAIVRALRLRMEMAQYRGFAMQPVLVIAYMEDTLSLAQKLETNLEMKGGYTIAQYELSKGGEGLVIKYSQRLLFTKEMGRASLEKLLRYYFCEPVMAGPLAEGKSEGDPWRLLQRWASSKRRWWIPASRSSNGDDDLEDEKASEGRFLRYWFSKRLSFVND
ncbi:hypothetical protein BDV06DRAFT_32422 [Aspergillus oleicola]